MNNKPVIIEEVFSVPVAKLWEAITVKENMKQWYFDLDNFEATQGFEFRFAGKGHKGETYTHICRITEVIPNKKLQYSWQYEQYEGNSLVTFELWEESSKTRIRLTHEGLETFPQNSPDFARESFMHGWMYIITESLRSYLGTSPKHESINAD